MPKTKPFRSVGTEWLSLLLNLEESQMKIEHKKIASMAEQVIDVFANSRCNVQEAHEAVRCAFSIIEAAPVIKKNYSEDIKNELALRFGTETEGVSYRY